MNTKQIENSWCLRDRVNFSALDEVALELTTKLQDISDNVEIVGYEAQPEVVDEMLVYHYHFFLQLKGKEKSQILLRDVVLSPAVMRTTAGTVAALEVKSNMLKQLSDTDSVLFGLVAFLLRKATDD